MSTTTPLQWTQLSKSQYQSTGRRFVIWHGAMGGFVLKDKATGLDHGPYSKAQAAKDKAQALHDAEYTAPGGRRARAVR